MPPPFVVPSVDEYQYKFIKLDNGIRALLIHDPKADKAAAACDVRVGSMSDPDDLPGLAHFLEHMLFYSSAKYPKEDDYSKFIAEKGGKTNAYTSNESTQYHFDVAWDAFPEALDRFAQFFISPLISQDGVEREVKAVDSEHGKNLNSDSWKRLQLWRSTANKEHPFSKFSTGNIDTLLKEPGKRGVSVHERVKQFYDEHYSASLMTLAVFGRHGIEDLEDLVRKNFDSVENKNLKPAQFLPDAVTDSECGTIIRMVPEREGHAVEIQWATLSEQMYYVSAPCAYISHLLGHEGNGSVFSLLKSKGWATGLVAGEASTSFSARSFFMVRIDLTDLGHKHMPDVLALVFEYLALLQKKGVQERIWQETKALSDLKFNYRDALNPYTYVSSLAHAMQVYDIKHLLQATYNVPLTFDPSLITSVIKDLASPAKARILWSSKTFDGACNLTEQWYGTKYSIEPIPPAWMSLWSCTEDGQPIDSMLHLPEPNEFIPKELSLLDAGVDGPEITTKQPLYELWYRPEPSFKTPKAVVYLHFHLANAYTTPRSAVLTQLYVKLVNDALTELTYPAELAGLHYGLRSSTRGLLLSLGGYWSSLPHLAERIIEKVFDGNVVNHDRFLVVKEKLGKDYLNMKFEQPYQVAMYELSVAMEARRWHVNDYETVLPSVSVEDLQAYVPILFSQCKIEAYCIGNLPNDAATRIVQVAEAVLSTDSNGWRAHPIPSSMIHEARVVHLSAGKVPLIRRPGPNPANDNSAVIVAFQIGPDDIETSNPLSQLVAHIGKRDAFYQLRTVEQLGYLTFFTDFSTVTVRNLAFIIQSSTATASYLASRVEAFLPQLRKRLAELTQEEFEGHVEELAKAKLESPKRLRDIAVRDWKEIDDGTLKFNREEEEVAALRRLSRDELVQFFDHYVVNKESRRMICAWVLGNKSDEEGKGEANGDTLQHSNTYLPENVDLVDDIFDWKRVQGLYKAAK